MHELTTAVLSPAGLARFWAKIDMSRGPDACWIWTASTNQRGYGHFVPPRPHADKKIWQSHRLAWTIANGPIPIGLHVCHSCDNPPCCNPAHLWAGTRSDNMRDKLAKGRGRSRAPKGEAHRDAVLTEDQVREIRARYAAGGIPYRVLAAEFGVHLVTISQLVTRKTWKHVA
jgi:hypothetical protein